MEKRRIVLLGATGYTGQRVLRELLARGEQPTLAGRNRTKMLALTGRFEADLPVAEVDVTSTADLARLLDRSDVVLSTVGPFMQLGIATVTAAAQAGAHCLDSSGEGSFVRRVFELDPVAAARGSTVVPAFGYDYVPGNLAGALALTRAGEPASRIEIGYFLTRSGHGDELRYTAGHHRQFGYFSKTGLSWKTKLEIRVDTKAASFLDDAASGSLPSVSWIDPAFTTFNPLGFRPNDDHAPADISDGQDLVLAVYDALSASPDWERSLLVIVYDEHGGFYDHVPPPQAVDDDPAMFGRYGVRVPAIIVSPWVEPRSVSSTVFDHTSIIKSVLLRFCPQALENTPQTRNRPGRLHAGHPQYPGARVAHAAHLGELLTRTAPRPAPPRDGLVTDAAARVAEQAKRRQWRNRSSGPRRTSAHRPAEGLPRGGSRAGQTGTPGRQTLTSSLRPAIVSARSLDTKVPLTWKNMTWRESCLAPGGSMQAVWTGHCPLDAGPR